MQAFGAGGQLLNKSLSQSKHFGKTIRKFSANKTTLWKMLKEVSCTKEK